MLYLVVCVLSCLSLASSKIVSFKDCGDGKKGEIYELDVTPCSKEPCSLKKGTTVTIKVSFMPHENMTEATSVVHGDIGGINVPFPLPNPNVCRKSGIKCPMVAGQKYTYISALEIKSLYPAIKVVVKWEMQDKSEADIFCFQIATEIVS